jgi:hypothetical protein
MPAPARTETKLAAGRVDAVEALAKQRATLSVDEWIALMRRLRDEARHEELAEELDAFRSLHADARERLPADLRDWRAPPR